jgi:hypothetical protein
MQFEQLSLQEQQNAGVKQPDAAKTRLAYARSYMKKIVNVRVNLPRPKMESWQKFLVQPAEHRTNTAMRWQQGLVAAVLLLCTSAVVAQAVGWIPAPSAAAQEPAPTVPGQQVHSENLPAVKPDGTSNNLRDQTGRPQQQTTTNQASATQNEDEDEDRNRVGTSWSYRLSVGAAALMALVFLVIVFRRPKEPEKAMDSRDFTEALKEVAQQVYQRTRTPREMRRFLNYLRLVAAPDDPTDSHAASIGEAALVRLAAIGARGTNEAPEAVQLFKERCDLFGLDSQNFMPKDEREDEAQWH